MNAFCASENFESFIVFRSSQPKGNDAENSSSKRSSFRDSDHPLGDPKCRAEAINVADDDTLAIALARADLCINAVPTFAGHQMRIFDACLAAGTTYVDFGGMGVYTVKQRQRADEWRARGATAILGLGADPGISNVICRAVADRLDRIDSINLFWAAKLIGDENPVLSPPYALSTILGEYANPSQQFLDGALREIPPQSGRETLELPAPFGVTEFIYTQHSEPLTVPFAEGIADKGIREFTWKLHLPEREHEAWVGLVKAGFGDFDDPIDVEGTPVKPLAFLEALIRRNLERRGNAIPKQASHELHLAIGDGIKDGKPVSVNLAVLGGPEIARAGFIDPATSIGMSIGVQLLAASNLRPGVWGPEEYFETSAFLSELTRRNFKVVEDLAVVRIAFGSGIASRSADQHQSMTPQTLQTVKTNV
ncbi:saccharopine dehydrogenase NADP-binding domain-containing protein [Boseaceae bacterium BT-24-1]|nr:saccharopine dehydrogenase NADP-binding domain-containing protein [Boseaceae bacterium BT-24-1]